MRSGLSYYLGEEFGIYSDPTDSQYVTLVGHSRSKAQPIASAGPKASSLPDLRLEWVVSMETMNIMIPCP